MVGNYNDCQVPIRTSSANNADNFLFFRVVDDQQRLIAQLTAELEVCQAWNSEYRGAVNNIQRQLLEIRATTAHSVERNLMAGFYVFAISCLVVVYSILNTLLLCFSGQWKLKRSWCHN